MFSPQRFRKRPVEIEALRYDGENMIEVVAFVGVKCAVTRAPGNPIAIDTIEGLMAAQPGDWIIKGIKGEFYPCKPDIFDQTYDAVEA